MTVTFKMPIQKIIIFLVLDDVPWSTSYGVYPSQLIRLARVSSHVNDFNIRNKILTANLLRQGYILNKKKKKLDGFYFSIIS